MRDKTIIVAVSILLAFSFNLYSQTGKLRTEGDPLLSAGAEANVLNANAVENVDFFTLEKTVGIDVQPITLNAAKVDRTFEGFGFDDNPVENINPATGSGVRFIPPDPIGAAGHSRVIAVVNSMIEARTHGGKLKWREGLRDFYSTLSPGAFPFDPKIIYDQYENRFVVVALELIIGTSSIDPDNISRILLAVSKDDNPKTATAADWYFHAINAKQTIGTFELWADYPGFEADEEAVYITANIFTFVPFGLFGGVRLWIVDKGVGSGGFYDGGPAGVTVHNPYASAGIATTTMPAQVYGDNGVGPGIGTFLVSYSGLTDGVDEFVQVVRVDDPLGTPTFTQEFVNIGSIEDIPPFTALPDAPQLGSTFLIEVNDRRALDCVWRDGGLWLTTTIEPESGPDTGETTAHWFNLNTSAVTSSASPAGLITLDQQGNIGGEDIAPGTFTYFPAVAVNRNNEAKFGFSASAPTIFAGAFVTGRQPGDPAGTVQGSETVKAGEGPYKRFFGGTRNRWGDYSGISVDPSNDDFFWVFNEFADTPGSPTVGSQGPEDGRWGTAWGRCKFQGPASLTKFDDVEERRIEITAVPDKFALEQNYPNPFNPETKISYQLPVESHVSIKVFNLTGQLVRTLVEEFKTAGVYTVVWEGRNDTGLSLPSGAYFYRINAGDFQQTLRMILLK